jgi:superfamily II DNA/RNA helicase
MNFKDMSISARTLSALDEMGYNQATEVQEKAIPLVLQGEDVIVRSQTGTGKTAAFGIGLIEIISRDRSKKGLILAPTRELAQQITSELRSIAKSHDMHIFAVYGGAGMGAQKAALRRGYDILVATPGRLLDHVKQGNLRLSGANIIVLDEADRMLDIGFKPDIDRIMGMTSRERQVLLFSATVDARIKSITKEYMAVPELIEIGPVGKVVKITEESIHLAREEKLDKLREILLREPQSRTIVFVRSKRAVDHVCRKLVREGIDARSIHGDKSQGQRERAVRDFQEGRTRILIATDVAARGLHIDDVHHVINYDVADTEDTHTHRIGRTGRMGASGKATTFIETNPLPKQQRGRGGPRGSPRGGERGGHPGGNPYRPHRSRRY